MDSFTSHRRLLIACIAILSIAVAIGGCIGSPSGAVLKGYVTEIDTKNLHRFEGSLLSSAPGVEGAHVTLERTGQVATTNGHGEFTFRNVSPGTYNVAVSKTGWASATAYNVRVDSNRTNEVTLGMVKPGGDVEIRKASPPTVSVVCPSPIRDTVDIDVSARSASGINAILLFIDNSYVKLFRTGAGGRYQWDTLSAVSGADNGEHTITAMAMDMYGNIGYESIVVMVDNIGKQAPIPQTPTNVSACATTVHYSVVDLLNGLEEKYEPVISSSLADRILALVKNLNKTTSLVRPLAMPAGSEAIAFCQVTWQTRDRLADLSGFKIYQDGVFIGESPAAQAGSTSLLIGFPNPPAQTGYYIDGSSKLTPNVPVSYRVSAYNPWGEGNRSASVTTTPLGALNKVSLRDPYVKNGFLRFTWLPVNNAKLYAFRIIDSSSGSVVEQIYQAANEASVDPNALELGKEYHWYVLAIDSFPSPPAVFDPNTWSPSQMSVSASELRSFILRP